MSMQARRLNPAPPSAGVATSDQMLKSSLDAGPFDAFRDMLLASEDRLSQQDFYHIQAHFLTSQHPSITLEKVREIHAAIRSSIVTLRASWSAVRADETSLGVSGESNTRAGQYYFLMDSGRLRYDETVGRSLDNLTEVHARSYDGEVERVYDADVYGRRAVMHDLIQTSYYFDRHHPLWIAQLIDSSRDLGENRSGSENFQNRYAYPLEALGDFQGRQCIVLFANGDRYYVDPAMNYAYCGREGRQYRFSEQEGRLVDAEQYRTTVLSDFRDCGNGVWLPGHAAEYLHRGGESFKVLEVNVTELTVNGEVALDEFAAVIPDGVDVFDGQRNIAFISGVVEPAVAEVVPAQPGPDTRLRTVIIIVNAVALLLCLVLVVRRTMLRRRSS